MGASFAVLCSPTAAPRSDPHEPNGAKVDRDKRRTTLLASGSFPELVTSGVLPPPTDAECKSMSDEFRNRQASGTLPPLPPQPGKLPRSAAYVRFSCDNFNPKSLDDQLTQIPTRARREEEFIPWAWVFADSGLSGRTPRRGSYAALKLLLRDAHHRVRTVFIDDFSRGVGDPTWRG